MDTERNKLYQIIQQYQARIKNLERLNTQLTKIIQITQISQYKQLLQRLSDQQAQFSSKISQLNLKITQLQTELQFNKSRSSTLVDQISKKLDQSNKTVVKLQLQISKKYSQINNLNKQLHEHKKMIKNQQQLIDEYKKSIQQEKQIQREIAKCQLRQFQTKLKKQTDQKIQKVKNHYEKILSKVKQNMLEKQYQKQIGNLGVFLSQKKAKTNPNILSKSTSKNKANHINNFIHIQEDVNQYQDQIQLTLNKTDQLSINQKYQSLQSTLQSKAIFSHYKINTKLQNSLLHQHLNKKEVKLQKSKQNKSQQIQNRNPLANITNKCTNSIFTNCNTKLKNQQQNKQKQFSPFDSFNISPNKHNQQNTKMKYFTKNIIQKENY